MKFKLFFNDSSTFELKGDGDMEDNIIKQMNKPQDKRNYIYGVEFTAVDRVEVRK
jgi:hypothetical protein